MEIPSVLVDRIRQGQVILFLGAGASLGAQRAGGGQFPTTLELTKLLSTKFLDGEESNRPLAIVAELCISETDVQTVQQFIRDVFVEYNPASFHLLIPSFKWIAIATTNYDLIVEKAYQDTKNRLQQLVCFYKNTDRVDSQVRNADSVQYIKLHGCISRWDDVDIPLILTVDQYVEHQKNRNKLFERLKYLASEYIVVFAGHSLEDLDLRQILLQLADSDSSRPRYYVVAPNASGRQTRFWESKKITHLPGSLQQFFESIDVKIDSALRSIALPAIQHPLERRIVQANVHFSQQTLNRLNIDATFIRADLASEPATPKNFYRGYSYGWSAIQGDLDSKRLLTDTVISDTVLIDDVDRHAKCDLYVIRGHAGSGKTVILKRIAWDAATVFGKLCLWWNTSSRINIELVSEIYEATQERVFLFVDRASDHIGDLIALMKGAKAIDIALTIICVERTNEWNMDCTALDRYVNETFDVGRLTHKEIEWLIEKLRIHGCLGTLEKEPLERQIEAFIKTADQQLLVALYEATSGLPFQDIVFDEYCHIEPEAARSVYLTICALNRLGVPVRAGIIKRIHGVSFEKFKEKFFLPLESVVFVEPYSPAKDMAYRARHPWIADVVFRRGLDQPEDRLDLYLNLLEHLDIGYEPDRKAYRELIKARHLMELFSDPLIVRQIYAKAKDINDTGGYYHQQCAIYEMKRPDPNFDLAYKELQTARGIAPNDKSIIHSLADLELRRALDAKTSIERARHMSAAQELARKVTGKEAESSHGYYTLCQIALERLRGQLESNSQDEKLISDSEVSPH